MGFAGTKKGVFYLLGLPKFDNAKNILALKNVEYDLSTKNVLIKTAKWLLDETIRKKLESQMVFDMNDLVTLTKKSINEIAAGQMDTERLRAREHMTSDSVDFAEGRAAFAERRKPVFVGR
jgi:enoyl-CoA hydratase/carnithine racemase